MRSWEVHEETDVGARGRFAPFYFPVRADAVIRGFAISTFSSESRDRGGALIDFLIFFVIAVPCNFTVTPVALDIEGSRFRA